MRLEGGSAGVASLVLVAVAVGFSVALLPPIVAILAVVVAALFSLSARGSRPFFVLSVLTISYVRDLPIAFAFSPRGVILSDVFLVLFLLKARTGVHLFRRILHRSWPARVLVAILLWGVVSNVLNQTPSVAWVDWIGYATLLAYVCAVELAVERWGGPAIVRLVRWAFLLAIVAGAVGGLLDFVGLTTPLVASHRAVGPFSFPGQLGSLCVLALALMPTLRLRQALGALGALMLALLLSASRTAAGAAAVVVAGSPGYFRRGMAVRRQWFLMTVAAASLLGAIALSPGLSERASFYEARFQRISEEPFHVQNWRKGIEIVVAHPILGVGLGNARVDYERATPVSIADSQQLFEVHNSLIGLAAQLGLVGVAIWGYMVIRLVRMLRRPEIGFAAFVLLAHLVVLGQFNYVLRFRHGWVLLGLVAALDRRSAATEAASAAMPVPVA